MEEHLQLTSSELSKTQSEVSEMKKDYEYLAKSLKLLEEKNIALEKQQLELMKKNVDKMDTRVLEERSERRSRDKKKKIAIRSSYRNSDCHDNKQKQETSFYWPEPYSEKCVLSSSD